MMSPFPIVLCDTSPKGGRQMSDDAIVMTVLIVFVLASVVLFSWAHLHLKREREESQKHPLWCSN